VRFRRALRAYGLPLAAAAALLAAAVVAGPTVWARTTGGDRPGTVSAVEPAEPDAELAPAGQISPNPADLAGGIDRSGSLPAPTTATTMVLPVPEPLPADPYAETPEVVLGSISIPAIGLEAPLGSGMTLTAIDRGPSHWPGTARPGELGNVVVAGHRTTYSRPFHDLDLLQVGDRVLYRTDGGEFTYAVTGTEVVTPEEVRIADQTAAYTSTLFACHPPGSAAYRIVVHLQLLDASGRPLPPPSTATATATTVAALPG